MRRCPAGATRGPAPLAWALLLALPLAAGCGYRAGLTPALPPLPTADGDGPARVARTVGIEIFGNQSLVPNLEVELHRALSDAARRHTSLELVAPGVADIVIRGDLVGFERFRGARTPNNRFVETGNVVSAVASAVDRRRGEAVATTSTEVGFGTAIDLPGREPQARANALRNSADRLLLLLLAELEYGVSRPGAALPEEAPAEGSGDAQDGQGGPGDPDITPR